jgi:MoxR-like ATPase
MSVTSETVAISPGEQETVDRARRVMGELKQEIAKRVVGQHDVVEHLVICLLTGGHALLVGVPGLAKTLLIRTLASSMSLAFRRIQFTPDLMPGDITGSEILEEDMTSGKRRFVFSPGPLFANVILADEINRTPPKTQAALLEAMQEHSVTVGGKTHVLEEPFFVLATQNPIEQDGTYPLPEAQLDRFMFNLQVDYPSKAEEVDILAATTTGQQPPLAPVVSGEEIMRFQAVLRKIPVARTIFERTVDLVNLTRPAVAGAPEFVGKYVRWGAGPRASQMLVLAAKVRAALAGRYHVEWEDVVALAQPVLRHRILLNYRAQVDKLTPDLVIDRLLETAAHGR